MRPYVAAHSVMPVTSRSLRVPAFDRVVISVVQRLVTEASIRPRRTAIKKYVRKHAVALATVDQTDDEQRERTIIAKVPEASSSRTLLEAF